MVLPDGASSGARGWHPAACWLEPPSLPPLLQPTSGRPLGQHRTEGFHCLISGSGHTCLDGIPSGGVAITCSLGPEARDGPNQVVSRAEPPGDRGNLGTATPPPPAPPNTPYGRAFLKVISTPTLGGVHLSSDRDLGPVRAQAAVAALLGGGAGMEKHTYGAWGKGTGTRDESHRGPGAGDLGDPAIGEREEG